MKSLFKTLLLTGVASFSVSANADVTIADVLVDDDFISLSTTALISGTLSESCGKLAFQGSELSNCKASMNELAENLGFRAHTGETYVGFVFFHDELLSILNSQEGADYINALMDQLDRVTYEGVSFNLWDFTLAKLKGDRKKAVKYLAVLFQDDYLAQVQLKWLRATGEAEYAQLEYVMWALESLAKQGKVALYPNFVDSTRGTLYHFYVPWYLSQKMKYSWPGRSMAFLTPFLFNSLYEFRQVYEGVHPEVKVNYGNGDPKRRRMALVEDLIAHLRGPIAPFAPDSDPGNLEDMYLGFAGSTLGAGGTISAAIRKSFLEEFSWDPLRFTGAEMQKFKTR